MIHDDVSNLIRRDMTKQELLDFLEKHEASNVVYNHVLLDPSDSAEQIIWVDCMRPTWMMWVAESAACRSQAAGYGVM
jgi:hypothetical protein